MKITEYLEGEFSQTGNKKIFHIYLQMQWTKNSHAIYMKNICVRDTRASIHFQEQKTFFT